MNEFAPKQNEGKVKARVKKLLKELDAWYCMPRGTVMGRSGIPDFLICLHGKFVAVETKSLGNKPTALQQMELSSINMAGGCAWVVNEANIENFEIVMRRMKEQLCSL